MKYEKYLPIGTVVMLNGGKKRVMITGFCCTEQTKKDKTYDYCGLVYPEGYIKSDLQLLFDHAQIEKIYYLGLNDEEGKNFHKQLKEFIEKQNL